jgi:hypothetical protein
MTPVPPIPVTGTLKGSVASATSGSGRLAKRSSPPVSWAWFAAFLIVPPITDTKLGQ